MVLKTIKQIKNLKGKRVLLRLDLNVPLEKGKVHKEGAWRLERSLPTIKYLVSQKAKVIIVAHLGRPKGKSVADLSLLPVCNALAKLLKKDIEFWADDFRDYQDDSHGLGNGSVAMLENIRFEPREKKNCKRLAQSLSQLADVYVNDAFGNLHRQDSSMHAVTNFLPAYAGLLVVDEVANLSKILKSKRGLVVIFGGAKAATKLKLIKKLSNKANKVLVGGVLASTLLKAAGYQTGKSLIDKDSVSLAKSLLNDKVLMPLDVQVATSLKSKKHRTVTVDNVAKNDLMLDIGPVTIDEYLEVLQSAKLVVWNGPFGYFENKNFVKGSKDIMQALVKLPAKVILGGGETVELANKLKLQSKFYFISTGGGAMLTFLGGGKMPSLEVLKK